MMSVVQHSELFKKFEDTAVKAYLVIRTNANLFINLFSMVRITTNLHAHTHP